MTDAIAVEYRGRPGEAHVGLRPWPPEVEATRRGASKRKVTRRTGCVWSTIATRCSCTSRTKTVTVGRPSRSTGRPGSGRSRSASASSMRRPRRTPSSMLRYREHHRGLGSDRSWGVSGRCISESPPRRARTGWVGRRPDGRGAARRRPAPRARCLTWPRSSRIRKESGVSGRRSLSKRGWPRTTFGKRSSGSGFTRRTRECRR